METIFDKILAKQIPATVVYEDEHVLAFRDIQPQAKTHVLVVPKKKAKNLVEMAALRSDAEIGLFFRQVSHVAKILGLHDKGFRMVINTGIEGGQTVEYVHAHILGGEPLHGFGV